MTKSITTRPARWDASPSQDIQHNVTRGITTPAPLDKILVHHRIRITPGWDASPSHSYRSIFTRVLIHIQDFTLLNRERQCSVKLLVWRNGTTQGLKHRNSDLPLIMRSVNHFTTALPRMKRSYANWNQLIKMKRKKVPSMKHIPDCLAIFFSSPTGRFWQRPAFSAM